MTLTLLDWRRRVAALYAGAQEATDPEEGWQRWRRGRDALFAAHQEAPARYVRRLRLEGAHRDLQRAGSAGTVAVVASSWGFADQATFGRNFRAAYGRTPGEVRRAAP